MNEHYCGEWKENGNGNWVLIDDYGDLVSTVYARNDSWRAIWNGARDGKARRLKATFDTAEDACRAAETAIAEGKGSTKWWPPDDEWLPTKTGGYYRKRGGSIVSVKESKTKSWYAVSMAR